ncbi:hypothetical protein SAMN05443287_10389 [Micromonospora phaseoli]|uniref:Uncharacterized protein n=1 Tax=Micromonospora phaseoli TaxID=1144548 RepID=A0A1H6WAC1_9ACTN|nr:hypothetical protein [Micromonospora phaseoli]PZW01723.1 hypothetical protein CLV64_10289 [Micromonospora phaseoli]GIJ80791.1 hypothetical protein Xph01_52230 [Micromonospora phaseoli]SEJ13918.1 hypothetical protein SAMN05443287_10389 [Micromonospora phaseoli]
MTDRDRQRPLEELPEAAAAVDDDTTVPQLMTGGGPDPDTPTFAEPGGQVDRDGSTEDIIADPYAAGTGATGTGTGAGGDNIRTGAEQPWEPEDLVMARGQDLTAENVERARRDLNEIGRAAIEKTVP